jgi:hypothetical protein
MPQRRFDVLFAHYDEHVQCVRHVPCGFCCSAAIMVCCYRQAQTRDMESRPETGLFIVPAVEQVGRTCSTFAMVIQTHEIFCNIYSKSVFLEFKLFKPMMDRLTFESRNGQTSVSTLSSVCISSTTASSLPC